MPNYKEQTGLSTTWTRGYRATCMNLPDNKSIWFDEETVFIAPDGNRYASTEMGKGCGIKLDALNALNEFPELDDNGVPTGKILKYIDVYTTLVSLYYHVATMRDNGEIP